MDRLRWVFPGMVLCLLVPVSVFAQEADGDVETAEEYYRQGSEQYDQGEYEEAAESFRNAYRRAAEPVLLYNLALAVWRTGDTPGAIETMEQALDDGLDGDLAARAEMRLDGWYSAEASRRRAEGVSRDVEEAASVAMLDEESSGDSSGVGGLFWAGGAATLIGVGGLVGAAVLNHQVGQRGQQLEEDGELSDDDRRQLIDTIETKQTMGLSMLIGGAVFAVSGVGMVLLDRRSGAEERAEYRSLQWGIGVSETSKAPTVSVWGRWP